MIKAACAVVAAFSRVDEESDQIPMLLTLTKRCNDKYDDADKDPLGSGKGNPIRGPRVVYIRQPGKGNQMFVDTPNHFNHYVFYNMTSICVGDSESLYRQSAQIIYLPVNGSAM